MLNPVVVVKGTEIESWNFLLVEFPKGLQDPRFLLNFWISGLVSVECTEALYYDNPDIQNSVEFGDLAEELYNDNPGFVL